MNKIIFFLPGLVIGLLSNKVYITSSNTVSYTKISNTERQYKTQTPNEKFRISDFYVEASSILKGGSVTFFVETMPKSYEILYDMFLYNQDGEYINFERCTKKKEEATRGYYTIDIYHKEFFTGLIHLKFQISCYLLGIYGYVFGEFDMYFPGDPLELEIENREFYCPIKAKVSQKNALSTTYGEYYKFTNLKSAIEVDKYGTFYFNDLKLNLYREYLNYDITFKGKIELQHEYDFFFEGRASTEKKQYLLLKRENDTGNNCVFKSTQVMYVNPNNNFVSLKRSNNSIETNDFYFPIGEFDKYQTTTFYLFLYEWGYANFTCTIPFTVKFLKDDTKIGYEIVGEIDEKVEDVEMEEITL